MTFAELKDPLTNEGKDFDNFDHALSIVTDGDYGKLIGRRFRIYGQLYVLKLGYANKLEFFDA